MPKLHKNVSLKEATWANYIASHVNHVYHEYNGEHT